MKKLTQDLWPNDLQTTDVIPPSTIVQEQGILLGTKTDSLVVGRVKTGNYDPIEDDLVHKIIKKNLQSSPGFNLSTNASKINYSSYKFSLYSSIINYEYELFRFYNPITLYPVFIILDDSIQKELFDNQQITMAKSEEEFIEILKKIFSSQKTRKVIAAILSQAKVLQKSNQEL